MKKSYAIAALALATGMSAFAGVNKATMVMPTVELQSSDLAVVNVMDNSRMAVANAPMKVSSIDALLGPRKGYTPIQFSENKLVTWATTVIKGAVENEIILDQMHGFNSCICSPAGTVDLAAGTVTFGKQNMGIDSATGEMIVFQPLQLSETEDGKIQAERVNTLVLTIDENGNMVNHTGGFSFEISQGLYFAVGDVNVTAPDFFKFNEAEWTKLKKGQFTDNALVNFYEDASPVTVECDYYTKGTEILAKNPYASGAWAQANPGLVGGVSNGEGYIVFDVDYPDCVPVRPATGSGFVLDNGEEGAPDWQEVFLYNIEGERIYNEEMYPEDVEMELLAGGSPVSTFDEATKVATLVNVWFSITSSPYGRFGFAEEKDAQGLVTKWKALSLLCQLDKTDGVEGVEVAEEGAVKYFNMQGMEVVNPAKGQLVIKKQGNKAVKVVM